jgi:hypothetical protein
MEIQFTTRVLKEGRTYIAHALELDVSSCGGAKERALNNLKEAVRLFLEEAEGFACIRTTGDHMVFTKRGVKRPIVIPKYTAVPVVHYQKQSPNSRHFPRSLF